VRTCLSRSSFFLPRVNRVAADGRCSLLPPPEFETLFSSVVVTVVNLCPSPPRACALAEIAIYLQVAFVFNRENKKFDRSLSERAVVCAAVVARACNTRTRIMYLTIVNNGTKINANRTTAWPLY